MHNPPTTIPHCRSLIMKTIQVLKVLIPIAFSSLLTGIGLTGTLLILNEGITVGERKSPSMNYEELLKKWLRIGSDPFPINVIDQII